MSKASDSIEREVLGSFNCLFEQYSTEMWGRRRGYVLMAIGLEIMGRYREAVALIPATKVQFMPRMKHAELVFDSIQRAADTERTPDVLP